MTTAPADSHKAQRKKTRIARFILPQIDGDSALLPPDKWILRTTYEFVKDNKSFHSTVGNMLAYAGGGLLALAAGIVGAILLLPAALPAVGASLAAAAIATVAGFRTKHHFDRFKKETLPEVQKEIGKKYLTYKMDELKAAWQRNVAEKRKAKEEAKAKAPTTAVKTPEKAPEKTPEALKTDVKQPENTAPQPVATPAATEKKPEEKKTGKTLGSTFGEWAAKMAEERAKKQKAKQDATGKAQDAASKKQDNPHPPKT